MTTLPYGLQPTAYRLPAATRLGRAQLQVTNLARSLEFYTIVVGFRVLSKQNGVATLGAHGDDRVILELRAGATKLVPRGGRQGLFHFAILLPDRASLGRFLVHLSALSIRAGASDHLVSEAVYLSDPDGNGIEVYRDRPRAEWPRDDGNIKMATDPLDLDALVARIARTKRLSLVLGDSVTADALAAYGTVTSFHFPNAALEVPREDAAAASARILAALPVADLSIQDPPIEEVIRQAFAQGADEEPGEA